MTDQRGLIITTSDFTPAAVREAAAAGKVPISLIDGKRLIELLVQHQIGVRKKSVPLLELNVSDLVVVEEEDGGGEKSAALWPLPGGQERFFDTLMAFVDQIGAKKPTLDEMTEWVLANYETVTKQRLVHSYLRAVLYSMGIIDFDGDQVVLTADGEKLRQSRDRADLLRLLELNVLGVTELLEFLRAQPGQPRRDPRALGEEARPLVEHRRADAAPAAVAGDLWRGREGRSAVARSRGACGGVECAVRAGSRRISALEPRSSSRTPSLRSRLSSSALAMTEAR